MINSFATPVEGEDINEIVAIRHGRHDKRVRTQHVSVQVPLLTCIHLPFSCHCVRAILPPKEDSLCLYVLSVLLLCGLFRACPTLCISSLCVQ
jgi:hypothetical protein